MTYHKSNKLHIVAVAAVIRDADGRYLVVKRSEREIAFPGKWAFPGGKVEGDQTIEQALTDEVREEVGLSLRPGKILLKESVFVRPDDQTVKVFSYLCMAEPGEVELDQHDFSEYRWVTVTELNELDHVGIAEEVAQAERVAVQPAAVQVVFQSISESDG